MLTQFSGSPIKYVASRDESEEKMRGRSSLAVVLLCAAIAASCGSGDNSSETDSPTTVGTPSSTTKRPPASAPKTTTTRAPNPSADKALATSALLNLSDLPAGWSAAPHEPTNDPALTASIVACLKVQPELVDTDLQPHADSDDFSSPLGQQIESGVAVFPDASLPEQWFDLYAKQSSRDCLAASIGEAAGVTLQAAPISLRPVGDDRLGIRFAAGAAVIDAIFARRGRALAYITIQNPGDLDEAMLLEKMTSRLNTAA